jgi:hypothetical protein
MFIVLILAGTFSTERVSLGESSMIAAASASSDGGGEEGGGKEGGDDMADRWLFCYNLCDNLSFRFSKMFYKS